MGMTPEAPAYDYVIVGAGSSGCVLAARLSEDPNCRIALIEAGGSDRNWRFSMPLAWNQAFGQGETDWGYFSDPEPHALGRSIPAPRGKLLGGCSSINGMMYSRGHRHDYDNWAANGATGWSFDEVLPYFRRSERNWRGASEVHGGDGPLAVSRLHDLGAPITAAMFDTARALGHEVIDDFHASTGDGFSVPDFTVGEGVRSSTSRAFLQPAQGRKNLDVLTGALCTRILFEGMRAVGLELEIGGESRQLHAKREVILAAGVFNSPQLLLLSGIGPAQALRTLGIEVRADLPGVGTNLQDHGSIGTAHMLSQPIGYESELRFDRIAASVIRWALTHTGEAASFPFGAQGFYRLSPDSPSPDVQFLTTPTSMFATPWFPGLRKGTGHQLSTVAMLLHPESRGTVALRSSDPREKPSILYNILSEDSDLLAFREILRRTREFLETEPIANLMAEELMPGPAVSGQAEVDEWIRANIFPALHPVGTCAMGTGKAAVVDPELKVRGFAGLRVVDCSIMPTIVGGNTNAPAIMIAEKAADMIRESASGTTRSAAFEAA